MRREGFLFAVLSCGVRFVSGIERINEAAGLIVPEIMLLATVCVMFLAGPFLVSESGQAESGLRHRWGTLSLLALSMALLAWFNAATLTDGLGPFRADGLAWFVRGVSLSLGGILVLLLWNQIDDGQAAEAHACLLAIIAGVNLSVAANDLVGLFLGLELVSIPTYVLLYLPRRDRGMREATLKYFLLSIFSAGLFLYGVSWLFGAVGTTNFGGITQAFSAGQADRRSGLILVGLVFMLAGLGFRITAVPFHFYAPDVFQGVSSSAAAMLSFVPKVVGFAALLRLIPLTTGELRLADWIPSESARGLLALLAIITMFGGNLLALRQRHLHRLLAYSSVAHAGYMLVGLTIGDGGGAINGVAALLFYLVAYGLMTVGAFALIAGAGSREHPVQTDAELAGLSQTRPILAFCLAVCLFSLTGLPPTAGFLGKLNLFLAAWSEGSTLGQVLAITLAVNAVIAAWYYLRLIAVMYLDAPPGEKHLFLQIPAWLAGGICTIATVAVFVVPQWLWDAAVRATS